MKSATETNCYILKSVSEQNIQESEGTQSE